MSNGIDCFPFYVCGHESDDEKAAWNSFTNECVLTFKWISGKKVWGVPPELLSNYDFDKNSTVYFVKARAIAFAELPDGLEEANIFGPYPERDSNSWGITLATAV